DVLAEVPLAGAGVDHVTVVRIEGQRVHGEVRQEVGGGGPRRAAVSGLPDAAGDRAGVHDVRVVRVDQQRARATADVAGAENTPGGGGLRADARGAEEGLAERDLLHARDALARGGAAGVDLEVGSDPARRSEVA